ncbi:hypothetical protein M422DRAFT_276886 [Sphaerobolus stellatus SS14]|nr:hypothetical protein M422DRAFT_276886 [Sphaerobolus stellatus SS14]
MAFQINSWTGKLLESSDFPSLRKLGVNLPLHHIIFNSLSRQLTHVDCVIIELIQLSSMTKLEECIAHIKTEDCCKSLPGDVPKLIIYTESRNDEMWQVTVNSICIHDVNLSRLSRLEEVTHLGLLGDLYKWPVASTIANHMHKLALSHIGTSFSKTHNEVSLVSGSQGSTSPAFFQHDGNLDGIISWTPIRELMSKIE